MKILIQIAGAILVLSGCASSPKPSEAEWQRYYSDRNPSSVPTHGCIAKRGPNCNARILWRCPDGFVDGCNTAGSTGKHECVVRDGTSSCQLRIAVICPSGFEDGCYNGSTKSHACVPRTSAAPCTEELAMVCPEGFHDACIAGADEATAPEENN